MNAVPTQYPLLHLPLFRTHVHGNHHSILNFSFRDMGLVQFYFILLISVASSVGTCSGSQYDDHVILNDDVLGLIVFKTELRDPDSNLASWNQESDSPCSWRYVKCNPVSGRVSGITLDGLNLSGKIGRGLEKLQSLKVLSLSMNNFSGELNPNLLSLLSLGTLNLSRNSLSGRIQATNLSSSLKFLDVSGNSLSGPLPDTLFHGSNSLRFLSLAGNSFEGPVPASLSTCKLLNHLNLSDNKFSGNPDFANGLWSFTRLRTLDLSHNSFSGSIPLGVSLIHNLKFLNFRGNQFSGSIPKDIGLCPHLMSLDFSDNHFAGTLPESIQRLNALSSLTVSKNELTGSLPDWIGKLGSLQNLDLSRNGFTGKIPPAMAEMRSLSVLSLAGNKFSGSITEGLFDLSLEEIDLSNNDLNGYIPPGSSKLFESLRFLDLSGNSISGTIPAEMGLFANLMYLNLSSNNLQSTMPPEFGYFQNLTVLDLRDNALSGPIPADICDSGSLGILQLDDNSFAGPIPQDIGNCSSLYLLSLSYNNLTSTIPKSISRLSNLKILELEFNQLTGEIPKELGGLKNLLAVNVSFNRLTGRLPAGNIFQNLDRTAIEGNLGICSQLLKGPCVLNVPKPLVLDPHVFGNPKGGHGEDSEPLNRHGSNQENHKFLSVSAIVAISASILILIGVVVITILNVSVRKRLAFIDNALESMCSSSSESRTFPTGKLVLFDSKTSSDWSISPESLLNKAAEVDGGGGIFGTVYKASFGGGFVAIKKLVTSNLIQSPEDFDREVRILGKARHHNLIAIRGYYWTKQMQLLVSDYAPSGNLQFRLHERHTSAIPLPWSVRFKIMLGTAKGLAHLHHSCHPPIIHYNIKPNNILLDDNFNPKISDFGLARLVKKHDKHVISSRFQSALGYVAPELACQSLRVNEKCDVYGFGVLVLELVTGRRPVEYGEDNVVILSDHVRVLLEQGDVLECVDPSMTVFPEEEVLPVMKLALVCTSQIPSNRPTMAEVVQILQVIKTPVSQRMEPF